VQPSSKQHSHHNNDPQNRLSLLEQWLSQILHTPTLTLIPLLKEASRRTYYRVQTPSTSYVAMDAPPELEDCQPFIQMTKALTKHHVSVPKIYHQELSRGFLLLSDFGDQLLLNQLDNDTANQYYHQAMDILINIHHCKCHQEYTPFHSDPTYWQKELEGFITWYVEYRHQYVLSSSDRSVWENLQEIITSNITQQPQVLTHKDFHSRNLMCLTDNTLGVLDYQDALFGPITYDIASLLNDCYIDWPRGQIEQWCAIFQHKLEQSKLLPQKTNKQFLKWFDLTSLQRHLKNLGNFVRLSEQQQQAQFLTYLPRMHQYIGSICQRYSELHPFLDWFQSIHQQEPTL